MQQSMAEWLTASRGRALTGGVGLAVLSAFLPPFTSWLPGALVVLVTLRGTPLPAWQVAGVASITLVWWLAARVGPVAAILTSAVLVLFPFLLARVQQKNESLNLTFQLATVAVLAMLGLVHAIVADPPGVWRPFIEPLVPELDRVAALVSAPGGPRGADIAGELVKNAWGAASWLVLLNGMVGVFVGLYGAGRIARRPALGPAFRELKAGRTLAALALASLLLAYFARSDFASDALWVFLGVFVLQGLAVLHAARDSLGLSAGWLVATYVFLFFPVTMLMVQIGLASFGFLDNWFALRPRFPAPPRA